MLNYYNTYKIGPCIIEVKSSKCMEEAFCDNVEKFRWFNSQYPDIKIEHIFNKWMIRNPLKIYNTIVDTTDWIVQRSYNDIFYHYKPSGVKAISNIDGTDWKIYVTKKVEEWYTSGLFRDLGLFYSDQMILYPYIKRSNGTIMHGNGLFNKDKGILLIGYSGSGKSTLSKMLINNGWTLLCDDRTIIMDNVMYGHWCHGSFDEVNNEHKDLTHIYHLCHTAEESFIISMSDEFDTFIRQSVDHLNWSVGDQSNIYNYLKNKGVLFKNLYFNLSGDIIDLIEND